MKRLNSEMKQQQLEWRRSQVLELASQGYSQREIASKLQVDLTAVNRDIQFLRQQAQDNLQKHIHEVVPEEYQKCIVGMKRNLKQTLEIAETAADPKTKLQARAIANDCYRYIMDLCTNAGVVSDAIKFVTQKQEQIDTSAAKTICEKRKFRSSVKHHIKSSTEK
jgi:transposase